MDAAERADIIRRKKSHLISKFELFDNNKALMKNLKSRMWTIEELEWLERSLNDIFLPGGHD